MLNFQKKLRFLLKISLVIVNFVLVFAGCSHQKNRVELTLTNPINRDRPNASITISRDSLNKYAPDMKSMKYLQIKYEHGTPIAYQLDDLNGDGEWDELALLDSVGAKKTETLTLIPVDSAKMGSFTDRTQIWFARQDSGRNVYHYKKITHEVRPEGYHRVMKTPFYYQYEGPGWENDNVGFRMYFDERNGFDIWGKTTRQMILQKVGLKGDNYHSLSSWGMDVLHVGNTLGAGSIAAIVGDTIYSLNNTNKVTFDEVSDGPVRAIFDLTYRDWKVAGKTYAIKQRISIWGGTHGYSNTVSLLSSSADSLNIIAGLVTAKLWGQPSFISSDSLHYVWSYGMQSERKDRLGMAIMSVSPNYKTFGSRQSNSGSVDSTAYAEFEITKSHAATYYFTAGWEVGNKKFAQKSGFKDLLDQKGEELEHPIRVAFK